MYYTKTRILWDEIIYYDALVTGATTVFTKPTTFVAKLQDFLL